MDQHISIPINAESTLNPFYGSTSNTDSTSSRLTTQKKLSPNNYYSISKLWRKGYTVPDKLSSIPNRRLREYYHSQNDLLECMARASDPPFFSGLNFAQYHADNNPENNHTTKVRRAMVATTLCNLVLLFGQIYALLSTLSFSMLAVFVDALLDMISTMVISWTSYYRSRSDSINYPVGRQRLEPLGVIAMACLMTAATIITMEQSIFALFSTIYGYHEQPTDIQISAHTLFILLFALSIKASLFFYCRNIQDDSIQTLAEDHFNDCLSNSITLIAILITIKFKYWWVDPIGGIIISSLIFRNWTVYTLRHCDQLLGKIAKSNVLKVITFVACTHSKHIKMVDTIRAYHVGSGLYAEVHIVLDGDMPLHRAHDIGESLQNRIERIECIPLERCFVHLDVEAVHPPGSEHKDI